MSESYGALCSDFYINQRLNLKLDLPTERETLLAMFDRVRRELPAMEHFRRYSNELALETDPAGEGLQRWLALRRNSIRSGAAHLETPAQAYGLHRLVLETAPYFLSISPLDVDYLELLYGFDLSSGGNHDAIVFDALLAGSPLAGMIRGIDGATVDCQPIVGISLPDAPELQAHFEVKTRTSARMVRPGDGDSPPISVCLVLRRYGAVKDAAELLTIFKSLAAHGEDLVENRVVPSLVLPIREAIAASGSN